MEVDDDTAYTTPGAPVADDMRTPIQPIDKQYSINIYETPVCSHPPAQVFDVCSVVRARQRWTVRYARRTRVAVNCGRSGRVKCTTIRHRG
jgi:hypothetical protein